MENIAYIFIFTYNILTFLRVEIIDFVKVFFNENHSPLFIVAHAMAVVQVSGISISIRLLYFNLFLFHEVAPLSVCFKSVQFRLSTPSPCVDLHILLRQFYNCSLNALVYSSNFYTRKHYKASCWLSLNHPFNYSPYSSTL